MGPDPMGPRRSDLSQRRSQIRSVQVRQIDRRHLQARMPELRLDLGDGPLPCHPDRHAVPQGVGMDAQLTQASLHRPPLQHRIHGLSGHRLSRSTVRDGAEQHLPATQPNLLSITFFIATMFLRGEGRSLTAVFASKFLAEIEAEEKDVVAALQPIPVGGGGDHDLPRLELVETSQAH